MASFSAYLEVGGSRYPLTYYDLYIHQYTDSLGRPASPTLSGTITGELHSPGQNDTVLTEWMLSPTRQYDGFVHLYRDDTKAKLKTISFFNAYLIDMGEHFSASGSGPMKTQLVISPQRVAVGGIVHDNNWPEASHGAGVTYAQPVSYQEPQPKPKPKPGLVGVPPVGGIPQPSPPKAPPGIPRTPPRLPQIPRNVPRLPLPHPVLVFLAALFGWHDAGVANEWEQKLPEKQERRYRELEAKRSKELAQGGKLPAWEEEEFQALDRKKYPNGHSPHAQPKAPGSDDDLVYAPTPKHREGGWGTYMDLDDKTATEVLRESVPSGKQRYGYKDGKVYVFQPDNVCGYHGYPLEPNEIPGPALKELLKAGKITPKQYRKLLG